MPSTFLIAWDKRLLSLDKFAKTCKAIPRKLLIIVASLDFCFTVVAFFGKEELKKIAFLKTDYYDTIASYIPGVVNHLSAPAGKTICCIVSVIIVIACLFRLFYRKPALLIAHSTMGHDLTVLDENLKKSFYIKLANIEHMLPSQNAQTDEIIAALKFQDKAFNTIKQTNWRSNVFYYGVAHTPLIFRLGYQFGQTQRIRLLHRFRQTEDAQEFKELPEYDNDKATFINSDLRDEFNFNTQSHELLVALATTYPIKDENLRAIDPDNKMYVYKVQVDDITMGYDFFNSYYKLRSYADRFADDIRKLVKEKNIETIHLVISSSVPFTFYLAQQMNTNQYPQIIVYQYEPGKYTWGIDVKETVPEKAVTWIQNLPDTDGLIC